ncbi:hypothetical protein FHX52_4151 [Humibacillus xanthopallidus]|uniref:Uncharacterized protein n=1 Tax=Humibacillus xanthopallidus TaxID=412689 RepID=A0A543PLH7_9MICO|nr:hypothetical protein [Humibacillus xanthopallidus]TQN44927.1 hypothetical protein FHX52_4151 [Humibacillus xanthopallidus]
MIVSSIRAFFTKLSPVAQFIVKAVFLLGALGSIAGGYYAWKQSTQAPDQGGTSRVAPQSIAPGTGSNPTNPPHDISTAAPLAARWQLGTCLVGENPTNCSLPHDAEVFSQNGDCSAAELIRYAGGHPDIEVLLSRLETRPIESGALDCQVSGLRGLDYRSSIRGTLGKSSGDALRRCTDPGTTEETPCSKPHRREVFYFGPISESSGVACEQRLNEYIGRVSQDLFKDIEIADGQIDGNYFCAVDVRGSNVLTGSVRSLADNTLPIAPAVRD